MVILLPLIINSLAKDQVVNSVPPKEFTKRTLLKKMMIFMSLTASVQDECNIRFAKYFNFVGIPRKLCKNSV